VEFVTLLAELLINTVPKQKLLFDKHYAYQDERWVIASHVALRWPQSEKGCVRHDGCTHCLSLNIRSGLISTDV
jgi:hypothetical protein